MDDPGTQAVISSLAFDVVPNDDEGLTDTESPEGGNSNIAGNGSAEICERGVVEGRTTSNLISEA